MTGRRREKREIIIAASYVRCMLSLSSTMATTAKKHARRAVLFSFLPSLSLSLPLPRPAALRKSAILMRRDAKRINKIQFPSSARCNLVTFATWGPRPLLGRDGVTRGILANACDARHSIFNEKICFLEMQRGREREKGTDRPPANPGEVVNSPDVVALTDLVARIFPASLFTRAAPSASGEKRACQRR